MRGTDSLLEALEIEVFDNFKGVKDGEFILSLVEKPEFCGSTAVAEGGFEDAGALS